jgi:hypothetical protein
MTDQAGGRQQRFTLTLELRFQAEFSYVLQISHHLIAKQQRLKSLKTTSNLAC